MLSYLGCPAYAGMDLVSPAHSRVPSRLPRLRGDGPPTKGIALAYIEAAPPTRGWTLQEARPSHHGAGCPAYAGMDRREAGAGPGATRLPRLRGDGPLTSAASISRPMAAPPTRGWTQVNANRIDATAGCPAYAGMDPPTVSWCPRRLWLPRLRGDGPRSMLIELTPPPAAPPTRGWTHHVLPSCG